MEYITSRNYRLPESAQEFTSDRRYHLWQRRFWPYHELRAGDRLYWYETPSRCIVWMSRVLQVKAFEYWRKADVLAVIEAAMGSGPGMVNPGYFENGPEMGYCLAYTVTAAVRVHFPKPRGLNFPRLGWLRVDDDIARRWLGHRRTGV